MKEILGVYEKALPAELSWREKLEEAAAAGFDALEISIDETEARLSRLEWDRQQKFELLRVCRETGIPINTMCLSGHRKYPLGSPDPETARRSMEIMERAIEFAYDTGIRIIQLAGYDVYYEPGTPETRRLFTENLRRATELAAHRGVILAFETMENDFMNTIEKAMDFVRLVDSPYLQVYPDLGNITNGAVDPIADIRSGRGHIAAAHLKETVPGVFRNMRFGEGRVDFAEALKEFRALGCHIYTAEFWYQPEKGQDFRKELRHTVDFFRKLGL